MKFSTSTLVLLAATLAVAVERKSYIVTYDDSTPDAVVEKAIRDAISAGAEVTNQFRIIKAFSVTAPTESASEFISSLKFDPNRPYVEEDSIFTTQGNTAT